VNPFYAHNRAEINEKHIGVDRAHAAARLGLIVDAGVCCAMHTDTPVAPPRPLQEMSIAVNRTSCETKDLVLAPCERISAYQALKMKTIDAAQVLDLDGLIGSIEPGKLADFTILYENPLEVESKDLASISIWGTVLGGKKLPKDDSSWCQNWGSGNIAQAPPPEGMVPGLLWLVSKTTTWSFARWLCTTVLARIQAKSDSPSTKVSDADSTNRLKQPLMRQVEPISPDC
jgi:hypothetical protein